jgi:hypothetical protein
VLRSHLQTGGSLLEQSGLDDLANVHLGRVAPGDEFAASPLYLEFVQSGINGNPIGIGSKVPFTVTPSPPGEPGSASGRSSSSMASIQYIIRLGGTGRIPNVLVLGFQLFVNLCG